MNEILDIIYDKSKFGITKVIGFTNEDYYNSLLKDIFDETNKDNSVFYRDNVPFPSNRDVIELIQNAAFNMNLDNIEFEQINLTSNENINIVTKRALDKVLAPYLRNTKFESKNVKINFFTKIIVWLYELLNRRDFNSLSNIIYYGEIEEDEKIYFEILGNMKFNIVLFKPNGNINIDSYREFVYENYSSNKTLLERINAVNNKTNKSEAKLIKDELTNEFLKSGIFKPWIFRKGYVESLDCEYVVEDIKTYIKEDSRFRPNFYNNELTAYVPNFFVKINGTYIDKVKYKELIESVSTGSLVKIIRNPNLIETKEIQMMDVYSLAFVLNEDKTQIIPDKLREHKLYGLKNANLDVQTLIIRKLNDFYLKYKSYITPEEFLKLIYLVSNLPNNYLSLIENFDFPYKIPKLLIYLKDRKSINKESAIILHFFKSLAFDIVIFSPIGTPYIEDYLFGEQLSIIDLEEMTSDYNYNLAISKKEELKKSIFKKIFK